MRAYRNEANMLESVAHSHHLQCAVVDVDFGGGHLDAEGIILDLHLI